MKSGGRIVWPVNPHGLSKKLMGNCCKVFPSIRRKNPRRLGQPRRTPKNKEGKKAPLAPRDEAIVLALLAALAANLHSEFLHAEVNSVSIN